MQTTTAKANIPEPSNLPSPPSPRFNFADLFQVLSRYWGYRLRYLVHKLKTRDKRYGAIKSFATYSPWKVDPEFGKAYWAVFFHTLVDWYRCYELWSLVGQTRHLQGGFIEIGVWRGGTGALMAHRARQLGINAPFYLCDTFQGVVKASKRDSKYRGGEHADTSRAVVERLLTRFELSNVNILEGIFPDETAHLIPDQPFRFCHVDVDVYESAKGVVDWIWDRLEIGGVIVYDDYGFWSCDGVTKFVEEQMMLPDRMVIHNLNGHAIVIKLA